MLYIFGCNRKIFIFVRLNSFYIGAHLTSIHPLQGLLIHNGLYDKIDII